MSAAVVHLLPPRSKYGNVRCEVDGISFASQAEARRYSELKLLQRGGKIACLSVQPNYELVVNDKRIAVYRADFEFIDREDRSKRVAEEVKGFETAEWKLKRKLFEALYPDIELRVVRVGR